MAAKVVAKIPRVSSEYPEHDLVWSLHPVFLAMRIFGTDLDVIRRRTVYRRCAFLVLAVFILSLTTYLELSIFSNENQLKRVYQSIGVGNQFQEVSSTVGAKFFFLTTAFFGIALMVAQLVTVQLNWGNLWKKMQEMDQRGYLKPDHYNRIRKFVVVLMIVTILLNVFKPLTLLVSEISTVGETDGVFKLIDDQNFFFIGTMLGEIFQDLLVVLFMCLAYLAAINIEAITKNVSIRSFQRRNVSLYWIRQWKKNYFTVQEYVEEIDRFYGPVLIVLFCKVSVHTIVTCYRIVGSVLRNEAGNPVAYIVKGTANILSLAAFIVAAQKMEKRASDLAKELKKGDFTDGHLELRTNLWVNQIHRNMPKISPMGMFHLSPELIPTLIGITITYVLVLAQYEYSQH